MDLGVRGRQAQSSRTIDAAAAPRSRPVATSLAIATAWILVVVAELTGNAGALSHDALLESGPPLWIGVPLFLLAWQVMIGAMMVPASWPTIRVVTRALAGLHRPRFVEAGFLAGFSLVWTTFGLLAFSGDMVVHRVVDSSAWLGARPWLVEAGVLGLAGLYQFAPVKRRSLAACRHPESFRTADPIPGRSAARLGLDHGVACLGSSWALMLLMFGEGFANLGWMAALTALMVYETTGRHGQRATSASGLILLLAGLAVLTGPLPPV